MINSAVITNIIILPFIILPIIGLYAVLLANADVSDTQSNPDKFSLGNTSCQARRQTRRQALRGRQLRH